MNLVSDARVKVRSLLLTALMPVRLRATWIKPAGQIQSVNKGFDEPRRVLEADVTIE